MKNCVLMILLILLPGSVCAGEFKLTPSITVSEEYTDNVYETKLNRRADYITRVMPGLSMKYKAPFWDWDASYYFDYRYYALGRHSDDTTHNLSARGLLKVIDDFFFLEVNDTYRRVSLDVTRDTTNESLYVNQSEQNIGVVSPYFVFSPTAYTKVRAGYRYVNTWYKDPLGVDKRDHIGFLSASYEISDKVKFDLNYVFTRENSISGFYRHEVLAGPRYEYADRSFLFAQGGYTWIDRDDAGETGNPTWNVGITHTFNTMVATLATGVTYIDDPLATAVEQTVYSGSLQKNLDRGTVTASTSYTEYVDVLNDVTRSKKTSAGIAGNYELVANLRGNLGFTYEYYDELLHDTYIRKFFVDSGLTYDFGRDLTVSLIYRYIDYYSPHQPVVDADNKTVNRAIIEVRKVF